MRKLLKYYRPFLGAIFLSLVLLFLQVAADLLLPDFMAKIINQGILYGNIPYIIAKGVWMLAVALGGAICSVGVGYLASRVAAQSSMKIRGDLFRRVTEFANPEFDRFSTASLITRTTNDVQQIQMLVAIFLRMVCMAPIMGVGSLLMALRTSPSMSWTVALALIVVFCVMALIFSIVTPRIQRVQKLVDKLNLIMNERLTGILVIRAFNTQLLEQRRFDQVNRDLTGLNLFVNRIMILMMPLMMLVMNGISLLIVWIGAKKIDLGQLIIGDMLAFIQYTMMIIMSFMLVSMVFIMMPRALVSGRRIAEVLATPPSICDLDLPGNVRKQDSGGIDQSAKKGTVTFEQVSFRYPEAMEDVLCDVSFTAGPGETTAIIGSTGSGKSTVVNLIPRLYDVTHGRILLDGVNIREMKQEDLRARIGFVPQKAVLFSGTIESNLAYGTQGVSEEEMIRAAEIAQVADFILEKPQKLQTEVAQGGTNVSGGQKQRLSIARALIKKPDLFIFDDSFSALDFKTDALIRRKLKEQVKNSAILIVAQRISTIRNAERIIVLDEGRIVGNGTHDQLMRTCGVYREIALSQLGESEQAAIAESPSRRKENGRGRPDREKGAGKDE